MRRIFNGLLALLSTFSLHAAEARRGFQLGAVVLYQQEELVGARVAKVEDLASYIKQLEAVCKEQFAAARDIESLDIVVMIKPGRQSRIWLVSSTRKADDRDLAALKDKLEVVPATDVFLGPVALAIKGTIAGGAADRKPSDSPIVLPDEWKKIIPHEGAPLDDALFLSVWPDPAGQDDAARIPKGYVIQKLPGLNGQMLKPEGWHFQTTTTKTTLVYRIAKEDIEQGKGFITGFTINIVPKTSQFGQDMKASDHAKAYLQGYEKHARLIDRDPPRTEAGFQRGGATFDEGLKLMGKETDCRIGITTFANDNLDLMVIMTFGCPREEWEANQELYKTICREITLLGPAREDKKAK